MLGYLSFRFCVEFIKPSDKPLGGLSAIQVASLFGAAWCALSLARGWRARRKAAPAERTPAPAALVPAGSRDRR